MKTASLKSKRMRANVVTILIIVVGLFVGSFSINYILPSNNNQTSPYSAKCSEDDSAYNEMNDAKAVRKLCEIHGFYSEP